jgi:DNA-binding response OmpR family regulator
MGRKILIIDDNEVDLLLIKKHLQHSGYDHIITASDATEGLKRAIEENPDLVISDTLLPDSNGFEICRQIREICGSEKPKIIIITGSVDAVDAAQARRAGADDYCGKTSDCAPLIEAVKKLT